MNPIVLEKPLAMQEAIVANSSHYPTEERQEKFNDMVKEVENKLHRQLIFKPYTFNNLLEMPSKEWLLEKIFGVKDVGMIYSAPGCGKTFVVIDMIIMLCTGNLWAGRFNVQRCLNVTYCAGEGVGGLPSRFKAAAKYYGITSLHNFTFYPIPPQLFDDGAEATIKQFCKEWQARQLEKAADALDVLIIDTLHTATVGADENSAQQMGKALHACRWIANELGCAVILVHHTNKTGGMERGSSALRGAMDTVPPNHWTRILLV